MKNVNLKGEFDTLVLSEVPEYVRGWNGTVSESVAVFPKRNGDQWREIGGVTKK